LTSECLLLCGAQRTAEDWTPIEELYRDMWMRPSKFDRWKDALGPLPKDARHAHTRTQLEAALGRLAQGRAPAGAAAGAEPPAVPAAAAATGSGGAAAAAGAARPVPRGNALVGKRVVVEAVYKSRYAKVEMYDVFRGLHRVRFNDDNSTQWYVPACVRLLARPARIV
jgi:hypothetical protein